MFLTNNHQSKKIKNVNDETITKLIDDLNVSKSSFKKAYVSFKNYSSITIKSIKGVSILPASGLLDNVVEFV
jgi:hypothetical protein